MADDKFKLGNFFGIADDGLEDIDNLEEGVAESPEETADKVEHDLKRIDRISRQGGDLIKHPDESLTVHQEFRSPKNNQALAQVPLTQIIPNEYQPRRVFNAEKLQELADSIAEHGIIQPLVVFQRDDDSYEIIVGERRFRAAKLAGLKTVPVFVSPKIDRQTKLELAVIENVQRTDLNPIEEARAYQQLQEEFGLRVQEIAQRMGKNQSTISNLIRLLKLPAQIQRALSEGEITEGQARPLLSLKDHEEMLQMYDVVKKQGLKVREIEKKVREIKQRKMKVKEVFQPDPFLESLENLLRNKFGTRVHVNKRSKGGNITIEFYSDEELNSIVEKLA